MKPVSYSRTPNDNFIQLRAEKTVIDRDVDSFEIFLIIDLFIEFSKKM